MTTEYFSNKAELLNIIGDRISRLNHLLPDDLTEPDISVVNDCLEIITFLKDHKYALTNQGLNQLEYIIRTAEDRLKGK
jgi:hypothetical protein